MTKKSSKNLNYKIKKSTLYCFFSLFLFTFLATASYLNQTRLDWRYDDRWMIGKTGKEIVAVYGDFDLVSFQKDDVKEFGYETDDFEKFISNHSSFKYIGDYLLLYFNDGKCISVDIGRPKYMLGWLISDKKREDASPSSRFVIISWPGGSG